MAKKRKLTPKSEPTPDPIDHDEATASASDPIKEEPIAADDPPTTTEAPPPATEAPPPATEAPPTGVAEPSTQEPIAEEEDVQIPAADETGSDETPAPAAPAADETESDETPAPAAPAEANGDDNDDLDPNDPASLQQLLDPLPKDQLADLLRDAAVRHPDVLDQILQVADSDPAHRKIFVHGLGWDTATEALADAFRPYGEIEDCKAVTDKATGKSKGYGFVLFKRRAGARRALKEPQKKIGNRMTACQLASAGPIPPPAPPVSEYTQRKIYVSNVGAELDPHKLMQFFSKYGEIEEGPLGLDKATGKPRGFCLFVYKAAESVKKALEEPHKNYEGHILHCQRAIDGPKPNKLGVQFQQGAGQAPGAAGPRFPRNDMGGPVGTPGHLMAPSAAVMGFNQAAHPAVAAGLDPALGQALAVFLSTQGTGSGLTNILGALGSAGIGGTVMNQGGPNSLVNNGMQGMNPGAMGGYGAPSSMQGGYRGPGRTHGHMGGRPPYMRR